MDVVIGALSSARRQVTALDAALAPLAQEAVPPDVALVKKAA